MKNKEIGKHPDAQQFTTVSDYLQVCYEDGFVGTMYDLQGQGVPLVLPMNQEQIVRAVQLDSKISGGMYSAFGEDTKMLKKHITAQVSRGIATGMSFQQVAKQIEGKMLGTKYKPGGAYAHALTIARTEGHRIQCQSAMDALYKAKDKGADVVKQWDSTLDSKTRPSHQAVDGEIKELDEKFSNGLMFPGDPSGPAAEVCNCRCALLQRARWALGNSFSKMNNETGEIVDFSDIKDYNQFKKKYFKQSVIIESRKPSLKINIQLFAHNPSDFKTIFLPKKEYGHVMHEINTHITEEELSQNVVVKRIGDYVYTFEVYDFDDYIY